MPRDDGPFQILERINDNAYKLWLLGDYGVSATFNVSNLSPYFDRDLEEFERTPFQEGEDDMSQIKTLHDQAQVEKDLTLNEGSMIRGRLKRQIGLKFYLFKPRKMKTQYAV